jgi:hypothetical protein
MPKIPASQRKGVVTVTGDGRDYSRGANALLRVTKQSWCASCERI